MWTLHLLGPVRLARSGNAQPLRLSRKGEAALACLAARGDVPTPRTALIDLLWSDRTGDNARNALRQWLFQLRRAMGLDDILVATGDRLCIDRTRCDVDLWRFLEGAASERPSDWLLAASLYTGEFAEGLGEPPAFGQWLAAEREAIRMVARELLHRLSTQVDATDAQHVLRLGRLLVALDPLDESSYRALMATYGRVGMRAKAMAVWHECRRALRTEMGAEPSPQTRLAYDRITNEGPVPTHESDPATVRPVRGRAGPPPLTRSLEEAAAIARDYILQGMHDYFLGSETNNAKARDAYSAAARIFPGSVEAAVSSAWTYFTDFQFGWNGEPAHNFRRCLQLAQDLMRRAPGDPFAQALWGRVQLWQGDYQAAVDAFEYTVRELPENAAMLANAADASMRAGKLDRSLELVLRAQAIEPGNRGVYLTVEGNTRFAMGDLDGAAMAFESGWRRHAGLCTARSGLGTVYAELGRVDEARELVQGSLKADNRRLSVEFAQYGIPFADPNLRRRWVRAWQVAGAPQHEPRLRQVAG